MVSNLHWTCWCYLTVALFKNKPLAIFSDRGKKVNLSHVKQRIHFFFFFTNQLIRWYIIIWDIFSHYLILDPQVSSQYSTMQVLSHLSFVCFAVKTSSLKRATIHENTSYNHLLLFYSWEVLFRRSSPGFLKDIYCSLESGEANPWLITDITITGSLLLLLLSSSSSSLFSVCFYCCLGSLSY